MQAGPGGHGGPGGPGAPGGPGSDAWAYEAAEPQRKSRRGLIITLVTVAVLVVVGVGGYVGLSLTRSDSTFAVNDCVKQEGSDGVKVECSTEGAYRITEIVTTDNTCPDLSQPTLLITESGGTRKYACLAPAAG
jgi:hypothetical protein